MSREKKRVHSSSTPKPVSRDRKLPKSAIPVLVGALAVVAIVFAVHLFPRQQPVAASQPSAPPTVRHVASLDELLKLTPDQLAQVDIAEMNLLCATGLSGSEKLDIKRCLDRLDKYTQRVRYWTDQSLWDFRQNPAKLENSEAKFRVLLLISVLQEDFGVHYNDRGERNCDFSNSKNPFIHGMIDDDNGGTCASMPVMYVAVGRRLGYPMKLVLAKTHIFARWEDGQERFNIEGTRARFSDHPDSYYRKWPYQITDAELKEGWYLKSLTAAEELAVFLQNRGYCLMDTGKLAEAKMAFVQSVRLAPQDPLGQARIASITQTARPNTGVVMRFVPGKGYVDELGIPYVYPPDPFFERTDAVYRANMRRVMMPPVPQTPPKPPYGPQAPHIPGRP